MSYIGDVIRTQRATPAHHRVDESHGPRVSIEERRDDSYGPMQGFGTQSLFQTELKVKMQWYANPAEEEQARSIAERALIESIHLPYTSRRRRLIAAVFDRNYMEAMAIIAEIDKEIGD